MNKRLIRKVHRWLGAIAAIQLLIWTCSGFYFSLIPIEDIRGEHLLKKAATYQLNHIRMLPPSSLGREYPEISRMRIDQVQIKQRLNTAVYLIRNEEEWLAFNAETGEKLPTITETEARSIASYRANSPVAAVSLITEIESGDEYRGGELPAWKIELADETAHLYVGATSGQVRAVRTSSWRFYDFLWSLHIMDYRNRDNFNHWLLRGFSILGVISVLSGIVLFISSTQWITRDPRNSQETAIG
ncbi:MAG TPA: hypothetical protein QF517_02780 [Pseudomonadales bacterium]|nr:hypothetical protein [Pseudomonadales bacterium]MDP6316072.1 hypothetical protein [Pseudomonadales bacterium]MDP7316127.1 hypothetical protein [Pseudomonadales bacterium]MDP7575872.1 hypothetical protein [Pseudomonadales bacterium]HJL60856.1 hypothetical protein [Pseudomonadales bacterium]